VYQLRHITRLKKYALFYVLGTLLFISPQNVFAESQIELTDSDCKDIALVFLRGSGQNRQALHINTPFDAKLGQYEKESYQFFVDHRAHIDRKYPNITYKAVSIHDFPGKYDDLGYRAVGTAPQIDNLANAEFSFIPGDYRTSVERGVKETVGYLKDQIHNCPTQGIIAGGFSQGAQVMGDALFQLTPTERSQILGVAMFGDPKYVGVGEKSNLTNGSFPWRRGTATNQDTGILEPRIPYVPADIEKRVTSWCYKHDLICSGWSAVRSDYRATHSSYSSNPMHFTATEMIQLAAPHLAKAEKARGGILTEQQGVTLTPDDYKKKRDVMFLFNDNSNNSTISTFRYNINSVLYGFTRKFTDVNFAAKAFREHDYGFSTPGVDNIQSFLPYTTSDPSDPQSKDSSIGYAFTEKYPFGQPYVGGGDNKDPYQIAIERAVLSSGWRQDAEKNVILIVDRPPKDPYKYDICNSTVRQWLHFPETDGYKNCYTNYKAETWQKLLVPETCETVFMVVTQDTCTSPLKTPNYTQLNTRTLEDNVKLAQAYGVKVSIVIPHFISPQNNFYNQLSKEEVREKLKNMAHATGGTFIYYDQRTKYDSALLDDTLNQVFAKFNRTLTLMTAGNSSVAKNLQLHTHQPTVFDVSQSGVTADLYKWDFDDNGSWEQTTSAPLTDYSYTAPYSGFLRVQAVTASNQVIAETRQAVTATANPSPQPIKNAPTTPVVSAYQTASGAITVNWQSSEQGRLIIIDPSSNLPLADTDLSDAQLQIPAPASYQTLEIRAVNDQAFSQPQVIKVTEYVAPPTVKEETITTPIQTTTPNCIDTQICSEKPTAPRESETPITQPNNQPQQTTLASSTFQVAQPQNPQVLASSSVASNQSQSNAAVAIDQLVLSSSTNTIDKTAETNNRIFKSYHWLLLLLVTITVFTVKIILKAKNRPY
jgi:hypothetical protein